MPPPTAERLKVRCYRCSQLLAVAPNKAGTVVACPKCKAELLIPRQGDPQPAEEPPGTAGAVPRSSDSYQSVRTIAEPAGEKGNPPTYIDEIAALIPPEVAALRPEDLRVEAEFFGTLVHQSPPAPREPAAAPPSPFDEPFVFPEGLLPRDGAIPPPEAGAPGAFPPTADAPVQQAPGHFPHTAPAPAEALAPATAPVNVPPPLPLAAASLVVLPDAAVVVPPIAVEPAPIRQPADAASRQIREVVLPASVVLAWLVLVLTALPMAFLAGLLLGHFVWKSGP